MGVGKASVRPMTRSAGSGTAHLVPRFWKPSSHLLIAVARALLADTPVLVLDAATPFADSLTQRAFFTALRAEYPDKTLLVVAHRLYGIEQADQILVLEQGRLWIAERRASNWAQPCCKTR